MESEIVGLPVPDIKQAPFPENWRRICNACRLYLWRRWARGRSHENPI